MNTKTKSKTPVSLPIEARKSVLDKTSKTPRKKSAPQGTMPPVDSTPPPAGKPSKTPRTPKPVPSPATAETPPVQPVAEPSIPLGATLQLTMRGNRRAFAFENEDGVFILPGSVAVAVERGSCPSGVTAERARLRDEKLLVVKDDVLEFTDRVQFASLSSAAAAVVGGSCNGRTAWKVIA